MGAKIHFSSSSVADKTNTFPTGGPAPGWEGYKVREALSVLVVET